MIKKGRSGMYVQKKKSRTSSISNRRVKKTKKI